MSVYQLGLVLMDMNNVPEGIRKGQHFFNSLYRRYPSIAESIRGTEHDPFYCDERLITCIQFVINNFVEI